MSEYLHVERPFLEQLHAMGWKVKDQGQWFVPQKAAKNLRISFRERLLPEWARGGSRGT